MGGSLQTITSMRPTERKSNLYVEKYNVCRGAVWTENRLNYIHSDAKDATNGGEIGFKIMQFEEASKTNNIFKEVNVNVTTNHIHLVIHYTTYLVLSIHLLYLVLCIE